MITRNNRVVDDIYNSKRYPRLYRIWANAKYRCNNPNANNYKYYGGRGIDFYKGWEKFAPFCKWALANGYNDELTLDRVDVDKGYSPQNCRWISVMEQENNRTNNTNYTFDGETHTLAEWCRIYGLNYDTVLNRYANGKREDELFRPTGKIREEDEFEDIRYSDSTLRCWTKNKLILYINKLYKIAEQLKAGGVRMSEPIFKTLEMNDTALNDGIAMIVFDDKCITKFVDAEYDVYLDFQEVLDIAKSNGYTEGVILLICEDMFKGYVYKYDNYCDGKWYRVGITCGYA